MEILKKQSLISILCFRRLTIILCAGSFVLFGLPVLHAQAVSLGELVQGTDKNLYGMTEQGGVAGYGTIFKSTPAGELTVLHSFASGNSDGEAPSGSLIQASDGNFYGMTYRGGREPGEKKLEKNRMLYRKDPGKGYWSGNWGGTIFKCSPSGIVTILHRFSSGDSDGQSPVGSLIQASDGNLYGMTNEGGTYDYGTIFKCTTSGVFTLLHSFTGDSSDGRFPSGNLIQCTTDGKLYGFTWKGGSYDLGTLFKCTLSGNVTILHCFKGGSNDGAEPQGSLLQANDGNLYGMSQLGGLTGMGTLFKYMLPGTSDTVPRHSFTRYSSDRAFQIDDGLRGYYDGRYGFKHWDSSSARRIISTYDTSGTLVILHSFSGGNSDGASPCRNLIQGRNGNLYGMTHNGGSSNFGTIFKCTTTGTITLLHNFAGGAADGANPYGGLIQTQDGDFYGTTEIGGSQQYGYGTIFKCTVSGAETVLCSFNQHTYSRPPNKPK